MRDFPYLYLLIAAVLLCCFITPALFADGSDYEDGRIVGTWRWLGAITNDEEYLLTFTDAGVITMRLEVNRISGEYKTDGNKLEVIPPMIMTLAAWLPDSPAPEFLSMIAGSSEYSIRDGYLYIETQSDGGTLKFEGIR